MKCPKCGAEMKEGLLYCENCGEDIHIVPDFEPELEQNMEQSLKEIVKEVSPSTRFSEKAERISTKATKAEKQDPDKGLRRKLIAGWAILALFVVVIIWAGIKTVHYFSLDYQLKQAVKKTGQMRYDDAIRYYDRAMELAPADMGIRLDLAQVYFLKNDKENYEYWLRTIADDPRTDQGQLESIYGKLIAIYKAREDYQEINDMLLSCPVEAIRSAYRIYISEAPQFSVPSGEYEEVKALKLTGTGKGKIYYTLDGEQPDATKKLYTSPILMENGVYLVRAVFINENGVKSPVAEGRYEIHATDVKAPELNLDDGEYDQPMKLMVSDDTKNVYYTTNGTIPTKNALKYTEPIPLPLGESHFCFARLEGSESSTVVERTFILTLRTDLTPEAAVKSVREHLLKNGRIFDDAGHFDEESGERYLFEYLYVTEWEDKEAVFFIAEVLADEHGGISRTGNYYLVDAYNGEILTVTM